MLACWLPPLWLQSRRNGFTREDSKTAANTVEPCPTNLRPVDKISGWHNSRATMPRHWFWCFSLRCCGAIPSERNGVVVDRAAAGRLAGSGVAFLSRGAFGRGVPAMPLSNRPGRTGCAYGCWPGHPGKVPVRHDDDLHTAQPARHVAGSTASGSLPQTGGLQQWERTAHARLARLARQRCSIPTMDGAIHHRPATTE
jgi:hypothetical protein